MGLLIIQDKVQLCIFSLADLKSGKLKSDTSSLLPSYFTTESRYGFSGSGSILPHHLFLCVPPCINTLTVLSTTGMRMHSICQLYQSPLWNGTKHIWRKGKGVLRMSTLTQNHTNIATGIINALKKVKLKACLSLWLWDFFPSKCSKNGVLRNNPPNMEKK